MKATDSVIQQEPELHEEPPAADVEAPFDDSLAHPHNGEPRVAEPAAAELSATKPAEERPMELMGRGESEDFRSRWNSIQTGFVRNYALAILAGVVVILGYMMRAGG